MMFFLIITLKHHIKASYKLLFACTNFIFHPLFFSPFEHVCCLNFLFCLIFFSFSFILFYLLFSYFQSKLIPNLIIKNSDCFILLIINYSLLFVYSYSIMCQSSSLEHTLKSKKLKISKPVNIKSFLLNHTIACLSIFENYHFLCALELMRNSF